MAASGRRCALPLMLSLGQHGHSTEVQAKATVLKVKPLRLLKQYERGS